MPDRMPEPYQIGGNPKGHKPHGLLSVLSVVEMLQMVAITAASIAVAMLYFVTEVQG
jgi:hypothetical protein